MAGPAIGEVWKDGHLWEYAGRNRLSHSESCPCGAEVGQTSNAEADAARG